MIIFNVLSFDPEKIRVEKTKTGLFVCKKTTYSEYLQMDKAKKWLLKSRVPLEYEGSEYKVLLPQKIGWNRESDELITSFCYGDNFETRITQSSKEHRYRCVTFAKSFLLWMKLNGFLWKGAAPRNIIVNSKDKVVSLVDFERPLCFIESVVNQEFKQFLIGTIHEEFSCFFTEEEMEELFPNIWRNSQADGKMLVTSSRQRKLIEVVYGVNTDEVLPNIYNETAKMMSWIATPFGFGKGIFYPAIMLEELKGGQRYVNALLALLESAKFNWPKILKKRIGL